jgi:hypothetical protein
VPTYRNLVMRSNAAPGLVRLLSSRHSAGAEAAAHCLWTLASGVNAQLEILAAGAAPAILGLLRSGDKSRVRDGCVLAASLAGSGEGQAILDTAGVIDWLHWTLNHAVDSESREAAAVALEAMATPHADWPEAALSVGFNQLVDILGEDRAPPEGKPPLSTDHSVRCNSLKSRRLLGSRSAYLL